MEPALRLLFQVVYICEALAGDLLHSICEESTCEQLPGYFLSLYPPTFG